MLAGTVRRGRLGRVRPAVGGGLVARHAGSVTGGTRVVGLGTVNPGREGVQGFNDERCYERAANS